MLRTTASLTGLPPPLQTALDATDALIITPTWRAISEIPEVFVVRRGSSTATRSFVTLSEAFTYSVQGSSSRIPFSGLAWGLQPADVAPAAGMRIVTVSPQWLSGTGDHGGPDAGSAQMPMFWVCEYWHGRFQLELKNL